MSSLYYLIKDTASLGSFAFFTSLFSPELSSSSTISIIDVSNSCVIASCDFFFVVFLATLRSYILKRVFLKT